VRRVQTSRGLLSSRPPCRVLAPVGASPAREARQARRHASGQVRSAAGFQAKKRQQLARASPGSATASSAAPPTLACTYAPAGRQSPSWRQQQQPRAQAESLLQNLRRRLLVYPRLPQLRKVGLQAAQRRGGRLVRLVHRRADAPQRLRASSSDGGGWLAAHPAPALEGWCSTPTEALGRRSALGTCLLAPAQRSAMPIYGP